ncbi:DUF4873 domain-containing protein [Rhodococcus xishaensis]|uniref:DUF4873 domain-containing protein n=1 Tax=Rhodococcus xishaensis TaxID=2487364 RepID=A0A3S3DXE6_9NOCA|nr:DUF4873 domain-containing protein [Rhodococcus xishaensis]RVW01210.1 DUF4873 domain-containing protein [Rhodococcus xishaensis]
MAGYRGPAHVTVAHQHPVIVGVELSGNFEPISGRYVWRGRVRGLKHALGSPNEVESGSDLVITTPAASGVARVSGVDLWGNHMVDGVTRPPFPAMKDVDGPL